eukprot:232427-Prymnesium_polylepis.1
MPRQYRKRPQDDEEDGAQRPPPQDRETTRNRSRSRSRSEERTGQRTGQRDSALQKEESAKPTFRAPPLHSIHRGKITAVREFGCFVRVHDYDREGLIHISQVSDVRIEPEELKRLLP